MTAISRISQLGARHIERHWLLVERVVEEIFEADPLMVPALRQIVNEWPQNAQLLFYHDVPFNVAINLCGKNGGDITKERQNAYLALWRRVHAEELYEFLKNRKNPVNIIWAYKMVFGGNYDWQTKANAYADLVMARKVEPAVFRKKCYYVKCV